MVVANCAADDDRRFPICTVTRAISGRCSRANLKSTLRLCDTTQSSESVVWSSSSSPSTSPTSPYVLFNGAALVLRAAFVFNAAVQPAILVIACLPSSPPSCHHRARSSLNSGPLGRPHPRLPPFVLVRSRRSRSMPCPPSNTTLALLQRALALAIRHCPRRRPRTTVVQAHHPTSLSNAAINASSAAIHSLCVQLPGIGSRVYRSVPPAAPTASSSSRRTRPTRMTTLQPRLSTVAIMSRSSTASPS